MNIKQALVIAVAVVVVMQVVQVAKEKLLGKA